MIAKPLILFIALLIPFDNYSQDKDTLEYIFIGHTKYKINNEFKVDPRIESIDYKNYDRIWLGGDITDESNLNYSTLEYIDKLFDVSNPSNLWAFGNHDLRNYNTEWLMEITKKNIYYNHYQDGITTVVLNYGISPSDCENLNKQFEMIKNICDTIKNSSHLIIISHYCVWNNIPGLKPPSYYAHSSLKGWIANCFDKNSTYKASIYPMLKKVKNKGIEVINILGDTGTFHKGKSFVSKDGIHFIVSGISSKTQEKYGKDKVLIFKHHPKSNHLEWQFRELESL